MNDELNLEPYRKAWKAEKERQQSAPPRHSEQDIAAMLSRYNATKNAAPIQPQQRRRTLPIWLGSAAASVAILVGVVWVLGLRPTTNPTILPTVAELRPHSNPTLSTTQDNSNTISNPIVLTTPPSLHSRTHTIRSFQEPQFNLPSVGNTEAHRIIDEETLPTDTYNTEVIPNGHPDAKPSVQPSTTQSQLQAFRESGINSTIDKQKTPKDPLVRTRTSLNQTMYYFPNLQVGLSLGATTSLATGTQAIAGIVATKDAKSNGTVCAHNQGAVYLLFDMPFATGNDSMSVGLQYGYGLSCRPTDNLTMRLNMGGYIMFGNFDLGLRLNAEVSYRLSEYITLTTGYQYYMPGIVSGEGRHAAMLSVGYIID